MLCGTTSYTLSKRRFKIFNFYSKYSNTFFSTETTKKLKYDKTYSSTRQWWRNDFQIIERLYSTKKVILSSHDNIYLHNVLSSNNNNAAVVRRKHYSTTKTEQNGKFDSTSDTAVTAKKESATKSNNAHVTSSNISEIDNLTSFGGGSTSATLGPDTSISNNKTGSGGSSKDGPRVLFPWRHDTLLLNRLIPNTKKNNMPGPMGVPFLYNSPPLTFFLYVISCRILRWSFYDIFISRQSQQILADTCAIAFQNCVACLVSHTFQVPLDKVNDLENGRVNFNLNNNNIANAESEEGENASDGTIENAKEVKDEVLNDKEVFVVDDIALEGMMDKTLLDIYKNASKLIPKPREETDTIETKDGSDVNAAERTTTDLEQQQKSLSSPLSVLLDMEIQSAKLINLHFVPILTRRAVERHPQHQYALQKIIQNAMFNRQQGMSFGRSIMYLLEEFEYLDQQLWQDDIKVSPTSTRRGRRNNQSNVGNPYFQNIKPDVTLTVVAQVLITCNERFRVTDNHTGIITQGDPKAHRHTIPHLVKFEMIHKAWFDDGSSIGNDYVESSQWIITDWDDLLEGNQYY